MRGWREEPIALRSSGGVAAFARSEGCWSNEGCSGGEMKPRRKLKRGTEGSREGSSRAGCSRAFTTPSFSMPLPPHPRVTVSPISCFLPRDFPPREPLFRETAVIALALLFPPFPLRLLSFILSEFSLPVTLGWRSFAFEGSSNFHNENPPGTFRVRSAAASIIARTCCGAQGLSALASSRFSD